MNLAQTEIGFLQYFACHLTSPPAKAFQIIVQCFFLYQLLGLSFLISVGAIVAVSCISLFVSDSLDYWMTGMRRTSNERVAVVREFLQGRALLQSYIANIVPFFSGIRFIKLQGLEESFKERILRHHGDFWSYLTPYFWRIAVTFGLRFSSIHIIAVMTFVGFTTLGGSLSASIIFPAMVLFDISNPLAHLNDGTQRYSQSQKPLKKIEDFLLSEESGQLEGSLVSSSTLQFSIILINVTIRYNNLENQTDDDDVSPFQLYIDELKLRKQSFFGISGPVGSGKSTFLKVLLGELTASSGEVVVNGRLAYCAQEPWIMQGSIEDNIVFGSVFASNRLILAIETCGLEQDLLCFPDGIKSMIGENGVNLSGGQKSRIALARAVYSDADVFLLDNPLASCDTKVAKRIFSTGMPRRIGLLNRAEEILSRKDLGSGFLIELFEIMDEHKTLPESRKKMITI